MTRTGHKRQRLVDCNIVFVSRSDKSPMPVRPMPSAVQARRVRIRARPRGIATVLGLYAVRLRAGDLHQIPTGLRQHNVAPLVSDMATAAMPKVFLIVEPPQAFIPPPEAKLAGPAPEPTQRACGRSIDRDQFHRRNREMLCTSPCVEPLMALSGHARRIARGPLSGAARSRH